MTVLTALKEKDASERIASTRPITLSVHAMGGQGGGVLIDWIVALAERHGHVAQATSVAGVAQRTGATLYYVELLSPPVEGWLGRKPVLALMPALGEVDIVVGAELMEAGRAIQRGLVTPDRTTLIASSHRSLAVSEKSVPGDGIAEAAKVYEAAAVAARTFIAFDMEAMAERSGSLISAVLFGALAGSGALPFTRDQFEATLRKGGVGAEASLQAFGLGFDETTRQRTAGSTPVSARPAAREKRQLNLAPIGWPPFDILAERARKTFPEPLHGIVSAGLRRAVDFQDAAYGSEYLDRLGAIHGLDLANGGMARQYRLTDSAAKQLARAMTYDDVIRVADLKTRGRRFDRVRDEVAAKGDQVVTTTEFMHPRLEELAGVLPKALGRRVESSKGFRWLLAPFVGRPRRVRTGTIRWFVPLFLVGGLRGLRRNSLRHFRERAHLETWLAKIATVTPKDYSLAVELTENRRMIKGYGDTFARGSSKFDKVMAAADRLAGRADAADWVRRLRMAALADEEGRALDDALKTVGSFLDG